MILGYGVDQLLHRSFGHAHERNCFLFAPGGRSQQEGESQMSEAVLFHRRWSDDELVLPASCNKAMQCKRLCAKYLEDRRFLQKDSAFLVPNPTCHRISSIDYGRFC